MQMKTDERDDAANTLVEAYKSYRRTDPQDAARVLKQAISLFTAKGNFRRAAGYQFNLAELYEQESELFKPEEALDAYDSAAEWYASDQADACVPTDLYFTGCVSNGVVRLANKAWLKVADLAALAGQYQRAIERYESVARASLNSNLTKWSVKDYFFKAGACYLANKVNTFMYVFLMNRILLPRNQLLNGLSSRIQRLHLLANASYFKYDIAFTPLLTEGLDGSD